MEPGTEETMEPENKTMEAGSKENMKPGTRVGLWNQELIILWKQWHRRVWKQAKKKTMEPEKMARQPIVTLIKVSAKCRRCNLNKEPMKQFNIRREKQERRLELKVNTGVWW